MILAQVTSEQITVGAGVAATIYVVKSAIDMWMQANEVKDRKVIRDQIVTQTEVLHNIIREQTEVRHKLEEAMLKQVTKSELPSICKYPQI